MQQPQPASIPLRNLSTEEFAAVIKVRPQTIRAGLHYNGHYLGLRPVKLPNRRLIWSATDVERLLAGEGD